MNSDRTKQICLWMTIYMYVYMYECMIIPIYIYIYIYSPVRRNSLVGVWGAFKPLGVMGP